MKQKKSELPRKPRVPRHATPLANEIRIIGGQWKRTKLAVADRPGLRPTPDRVRETLFNWLGQDLTGWRCMDVFAGTGVLGFEAASRGAKEVQLVELDTALVAQLKRTQIQLKANATQVVRGDGVVTLKQMDPGSMDVIFIDPPFTEKLADSVMTALASSQCFHQNTLIAIEAIKQEKIEMLYGDLICYDKQDYGDKSLSLFSKKAID